MLENGIDFIFIDNCLRYLYLQISKNTLKKFLEVNQLFQKDFYNIKWMEIFIRFYINILIKLKQM